MLVKGLQGFCTSEHVSDPGSDANAEPRHIHAAMIGGGKPPASGIPSTATVSRRYHRHWVIHGGAPLADPRMFDSEASMTHLIVGLTPTLARALLRGERTTEATRLREIAARAQLDLTPQTNRALDLSQDSAQPEAIVWFSAETGTEGQSENVDMQLLQIPGVTAAYVTPDQGPP